MKRIVSLFALLLFAVPAFGAVHTATTCNVAELQGLANGAMPGDEIAGPAGGGSATWNVSLALPKALIVKGSGCVITTGVRAISGGVTASDISGFTFVSVSTGDGAPDVIQVEGQGWRVHHLRIQSTRFITGVWAFGAVAGKHPTGTIDHVEMVNARVLVYGDGLNKRTDPSTIGVAGAAGVVTVEDSTFEYNVYGNCIDSELGARYILRRFKTKGCWVEAHSDQGTRNAYSWEIYDGTIDVTGAWIGMFLRGGTGVVYNVNFIGSGTGAHLWGIDNVFLTCAHPCRDQIGRGSDVAGSQTSEPAYFWNNRRADGSLLNPVVLNGADHLIQNGRDYFLSPRPNYPGGGIPPTPIPIPPIPVPIPPQPTPNAPPTVTIKAPVEGQIIETKTFTLSLASTDDSGIAWQELSINGQVVKAAATASMTYSWNTSPYKGRTVIITGTAKDADGSSSSRTVTVSVKK